MSENAAVRKSLFPKIYLIFVAVLTVAVAGILVYVGVLLSAYEKSQLELPVKEYTGALTRDDVVAVVSDGLSLTLSEYEDEGSVLRDCFLSKLDEAGVITSKRDYTVKDAVVYTVSYGKIPVISLTLGEEAGAAGMKQSAWSISEISLYKNGDGFGVFPAESYISVPAGSGINLNGRTLGSAFVFKEALEYPDTSPLELSRDDRTTYTLYKTPALYGTPELSVSLGGTALDRLETDDGILTYRAKGFEGFTYTVNAPSFSRVYINGFLLTDENCLFTPYADSAVIASFNKESLMTTFTVSGLRLIPEIIVEYPEEADGTVYYKKAEATETDAGKKLSYYAFPEDRIYKLTVLCPESAVLSVNNKEALSCLTDTGLSYSPDNLTGVTDLAPYLLSFEALPVYSVYTVCGLRALPELSCKLDGTSLTVNYSKTDKAAGTVLIEYCLPSAGDCAGADADRVTEGFAGAFTDYLVMGAVENGRYDIIKANRKTVKSFVLKDSNAEQTVDFCYNTFIFTIGYVRTTSVSIKTESVYRISEHCFISRVSCLITIDANRGGSVVSESYGGYMDIAVLESDGVMSVVDFISLIDKCE